MSSWLGGLEGVHTRADAHVGDVPDFVSQDAEATLVGIVVEQREPQILGRLERYLVSVDDEREEIEALRNTDQRPLVEAHGPFEGLLKCRQHASEGGLEAGAVQRPDQPSRMKVVTGRDVTDTHQIPLLCFTSLQPLHGVGVGGGGLRLDHGAVCFAEGGEHLV